MLRRAIVYQGRVQGVGFRAVAVDVARGHPVTGWVRNEPDFSVRLEVQGEAAAVEAMLAELRERLRRNIQRELPEVATVEPDEVGFIIRR